ncbi:MAG: hypothetical protein M5U09_29415 [Gammaproteobacteria bacterium]|nr:hypothetical protein [Gammaproteobacteria bacterium]
MQPIRVAAFGTGFFSTFHYDAWTRLPGVELVGICVRADRARAEEFAGRYGAAAVFTDRGDARRDGAGPRGHHHHAGEPCPPGRAFAAARSIPMICQKPLAPTLAEAERLVETAEAAGTLLVAHENWRFKPWNREIGRLIAAGAVGTPLQRHLPHAAGRRPELRLSGPAALFPADAALSHPRDRHPHDRRVPLPDGRGRRRIRPAARLNPAIAGRTRGWWPSPSPPAPPASWTATGWRISPPRPRA